MKNVLKGKEWREYYISHDVKSKSQLELYAGVTWNYESIYKIGDYFFCFAIQRGYRNISALKRLVSQL